MVTMSDENEIPSGADVSVAPNYDAGMVSIRLDGLPWKTISPSKARAIADRMDEQFGDDYDDWADAGYDVDLGDKLREAADQVEI